MGANFKWAFEGCSISKWSSPLLNSCVGFKLGTRESCQHVLRDTRNVQLVVKLSNLRIFLTFVISHIGLVVSFFLFFNCRISAFFPFAFSYFVDQPGMVHVRCLFIFEVFNI